MDKEAALAEISNLRTEIYGLQKQVNDKVQRVTELADEHGLVVDLDLGKNDMYHGKGTTNPDTWGESARSLEEGTWVNSSTYY